jgi:uncharacterized protein (TIGR02001 family)
VKKTPLALAATLALTALPSVSFAEDASPSSFNLSVTSDYRYRGISQTRLKPALQGGADYALPGGFYIGAWASTIKWIKDSEGDASVEIDLYGGYKGEITKDVTYDVGVLNYWYPSAVTTPWANVYRNPNTTELYGAVTFGPVTAKYSHGVTNLFGNPGSKNSYYLDVSASFEVEGISIAPHIGYQKVKNTPNASYTDYSITVSKDFNGIVPSIAIVGTDADKGFYVPGAAAKSSKFLGKTALVVGVKYNF